MVDSIEFIFIYSTNTEERVDYVLRRNYLTVAVRFITYFRYFVESSSLSRAGTFLIIPKQVADKGIASTGINGSFNILTLALTHNNGGCSSLFTKILRSLANPGE